MPPDPSNSLLGQVPESSSASSEKTRPEWLPEEYWDGETAQAKVKDIVDRLAHNQTMLRHKKDELKAEIEREALLGRPATPAGYTLDPASLQTSSGKIEIADDDPVLARVRAWAYDNGLTQEKFGALVGAYGKALHEKMPDPKTEMAKLGENAASRINNLKSQVAARIGADAMGLFMGMAKTAAEVEVLEKLLSPSGGPADFESEFGTPEMVSEELDKLMASDAYWKRDPATVTKVERFMKILAKRK